MEKRGRPSSFIDLGLKKLAPGIVAFLVVFILVCLPGDNLPHTQSWMELTFFDKWVHTIMFGLMTFFFLLPVAESSMFAQQKRHYFVRICLAGIIWGVTTEFIQLFFIPSRDFDLLDWGADSAGVLLAFFYCRHFHRR